MKKIFILATAAIVAFASCMKTEIVSNSEPQEIAFRQFTGSMTKAGTTALPDGIHMGVFAYIGSTEYFKNAEFKKQETGLKWAGASQSYYWPLKDKLDFTVYAPWDGTADNVQYVVADKKLTVKITNGQTDYLYGKKWYNETEKPATPSDGVPVVLKHALSKVTINMNANKAGIFTVESVTLKSTIQDGSYSVTYSSGSDDNVCTVTPGTTLTDLTYGSSWSLGLEVGANTAYKLVVPSPQTSIEIKYKMDGIEPTLTATIDLSGQGNWATGKHYIYNITLTADEILFAPEVEEWTPSTETNITNETIN